MEREQLEAQCPLRPGEPCALCQVGAADPRDCGLVYLVLHDDELREGLRRHTAAAAGRGRQAVPAVGAKVPPGRTRRP